MPIGYPLVNGVRFDASSIELKLNGKRYIGLKEFKYKQNLDPGEVRGFASQALGYTRGLYKVEGSFQIYREEFQDLTTDLQILAAGMLEANLQGSITYSETLPGSIPTGQVGATSTDVIEGMRLTGTDHSISAGSSDPLMVECAFIARYLTVNGFAGLNTLLKIATAAASAP